MAFENITLPSVWDIPAAVGVPALLGQSIGAGVDASASTALAGVMENWTIQQQSKHWGIFNSSNSKVLTASHVVGIDYETRYMISDAPLEDGAFTSFGKVKMPYNASVTMVCDGTESGSSSIASELKSLVGISGFSTGVTVRSSFINTLETIVADTNLYNVVTPEKTFINANVIGYRFSRRATNGITMIMCEILLQEVRRTASLSYTSTVKPEGAAAVQNGTVQTGTASTSVTDAVAGVTV